MGVELSDFQLEALDRLRTGSILCGGVGSGKSRTGLAYYLFRVCQGSVSINGEGYTSEMDNPKDLYIITTPKKRDDLEWEKECVPFMLSTNPEVSLSHVKVTVDSWNNIKKYRKVSGAFFIFDEQRLVGSGAWVKAFLDIARKNEWILLTATPGDKWEDYIAVFIANGFYKNKTEFTSSHCVYARFAKYPKIERYVGIELLEELRDSIVVHMKDRRVTRRHDIQVITEYDKNLYRTVIRDRWNPFENEPIQEGGKLIYLLRKVVNSDLSRIEKVREILLSNPRCIIFYNFTYELRLLEELCNELRIKYAEYNGERHQEIPKTKRWVYLVQYVAGAEAWNCTLTDTMIFYSQTYSYRTLEQAKGRIDRMNTFYVDLYYYHIRSMSSIDLAIYHKLKDKKIFNERAFLAENHSRRIHGL